MASTFGTLLSSQGADAHPSRSSDPSGGNFSTLSEPDPAVKPPVRPTHAHRATGRSRLELVGFAIGNRPAPGGPFLPGGRCTTLRDGAADAQTAASCPASRYVDSGAGISRRVHYGAVNPRGDHQWWSPRGKGVRRRPTLPHSLPCSTIGAEGLSFRVRNGTGRFPFAMTAVTLSSCQSGSRPSLGNRTVDACNMYVCVKLSAY